MRLLHQKTMLEVNNLAETIAFYTENLGFTCCAAFPDVESPTWAALERDGIELMFSVRNAHSPVENPTMTGALYFTVKNATEAWELLKDKARIEYPIEDFDYGMREFAIRDCNGYLLQFGQELEGGEPEM
ncbi:MAG: VOC family protein [Blastocatellia bacterium]|nr:VOC family protein [Blastocatellia bacterium]